MLQKIIISSALNLQECVIPFLHTILTVDKTLMQQHTKIIWFVCPKVSLAVFYIVCMQLRRLRMDCA